MTNYEVFVASVLRKAHVEPRLIEEETHRIIEMYDRPTRYYHTIKHISDMFDVWCELRDSQPHDAIPFNREKMVWFAILFHDIIYDSKWGDNPKCLEEASADEFVNFANRVNLNVSDDDIEYCKSLIISTSIHTPIDDTFETMAFLDADMNILSTPINEYIVYASDVRKEWEHIPDDVYASGRRIFLKDMLELPSIYFTSQMKSKNTLAKSNMRYELKLIDPSIH